MCEGKCANKTFVQNLNDKLEKKLLNNKSGSFMNLIKKKYTIFSRSKNNQNWSKKKNYKKI